MKRVGLATMDRPLSLSKRHRGTVGMVGVMVVAPLVKDSALSNEVLTVAASAFGGHGDDNQERTAI